MLKDYILAFITIFVAIDVLGLLPIFISITADYEVKARDLIVKQATLTAFLVSLSFIAIGKLVFSALGITIPDFQIAGGIILLIIAINDIIYPDRPTRKPSSAVGIVPIGIPLITGPAVLTTSILVIDLYGTVPTIVSLVVNMLIVFFVLKKASLVVRMLRDGGTKAIGKVASILLAAIAIKLIRMGLVTIISGIKLH
ncbi:MAG: MarC family protein [Deltaproteobacteria bacterium]|nr:MarC family protein [Deltaproteobacteria bacterium]